MIKKAGQELAKLLGKENVLTAPEELSCYSYDGTHFTFRPDIVVTPGSTDQVAKVVAFANEKGIPIVTRGGGTNVVGGSLAVSGGIVLALHRMNKLVELDPDNLTATVQSGLITAVLQQEVEKIGLFYPPDPSSKAISTMGGNVAMNAGGPRGFKYGVTGDYLLGLEVVMADGRVVRAGKKTIKNVSGYDLTRLMVGAEGTLGIITEITVRLIPLPESRKTLLAVYDSLQKGAETVTAIIREKIIPATLELMDREMVALIEEFKPSGLPLDAEAVILIEVDGSENEAAREQAVVANLCFQHGAKEVKVAKNQVEANLLWEGRRSAMGAMAGKCTTLISEDATVPRSCIPQFVKAIKEISAKYEIAIPILGHTGDGNLHPCLLTDERDQEKMERTERAIEELFRTTLALGGTLSGEHGIGILKNRFMSWEHGDDGVAVMKQIKKALDPNNILNPGKIFFTEEREN